MKRRFLAATILLLITSSLSACSEPAEIDFTIVFPSEYAFLISESVSVNVLAYEEDLCAEILTQSGSAEILHSSDTTACDASEGALIENVAPGKYVLHAVAEDDSSDAILQGCAVANVAEVADPISIVLSTIPGASLPPQVSCSTIAEKCSDGTDCVP